MVGVALKARGMSLPALLGSGVFLILCGFAVWILWRFLTPRWEDRVAKFLANHPGSLLQIEAIFLEDELRYYCYVVAPTGRFLGFGPNLPEAVWSALAKVPDEQTFCH